MEISDKHIAAAMKQKFEQMRDEQIAAAAKWQGLSDQTQDVRKAAVSAKWWNPDRQTKMVVNLWILFLIEDYELLLKQFFEGMPDEQIVAHLKQWLEKVPDKKIADAVRHLSVDHNSIE